MLEEAPISVPAGETQLFPANIQTVGKASYRLGPFKVYDAELLTADGGFSWNAPFQLKLTYARKFSAQRLTRVSLKEMARLSGQDELSFEPLHDELLKCFADVRSSDVIVGNSISDDKAVFSYNGVQKCSIEWAGFRTSFFGIWLSPDARFEDEARALMGQLSP